MALASGAPALLIVILLVIPIAAKERITITSTTGSRLGLVPSLQPGVIAVDQGTKGNKTVMTMKRIGVWL